LPHQIAVVRIFFVRIGLAHVDLIAKQRTASGATHQRTREAVHEISEVLQLGRVRIARNSAEDEILAHSDLLADGGERNILAENSCPAYGALEHRNSFHM
jgi:hypothetical protein